MSFSQNLGIALTDDEIAQIQAMRAGNDDLSDELYQKLFEHFCDNGEMPYGTAKARDGDPYQWIAQRLEESFAC